MNVAVIPCDSNVSMEFMSSVVTSCLLMIETSLLGALTTFVYLRSVRECLTYIKLIEFLSDSQLYHRSKLCYVVFKYLSIHCTYKHILLYMSVQDYREIQILKLCQNTINLFL